MFVMGLLGKRVQPPGYNQAATIIAVEFKAYLDGMLFVLLQFDDHSDYGCNDHCCWFKYGRHK